VKYTYDSWGRPIAILDGSGNDVSGNASHIANINPYRYRSYRYDSETGLYYLQSRYYSADWGRFINADALISTGQGLLCHNMYIYCENNPISRSDSSGYGWVSDLFNKAKATVMQAAKTVVNALGFNWNPSKGIVTTLPSAPQRNFGFCDLYDIMAPAAGAFIQHKMTEFDYGGKTWAIWLWKGNYSFGLGRSVQCRNCNNESTPKSPALRRGSIFNII